MPNTAGLSVVSTKSVLVYRPSFPFVRSFLIENWAYGLAVLMLEVKTVYQDPSVFGQAVIVFNPVNGVANSSILIPSRPWVDHYSAQLDLVSLTIQSSAFRAGVNSLEIWTTHTTDYLLVGNMWFHYPQTL